jgi:hypothetical protein
MKSLLTQSFPFLAESKTEFDELCKDADKLIMKYKKDKNMEKKNTPMIDFAPKAIATIIECQNILAEYVVPDSGISDLECINKLLAVLDHKDIVIGVNNVLGNTKTPVKTGLFDKNGVEITEGDNLLLIYESCKLNGFAKYKDDCWVVYKDKGNYLAIKENQYRISIIK